MEALGSCSLRKHAYPFAELNQEKDINLISGHKTIYQWPLQKLLEEWHKVSYENQSLKR